MTFDSITALAPEVINHLSREDLEDVLEDLPRGSIPLSWILRAPEAELRQFVHRLHDDGVAHAD